MTPTSPFHAAARALAKRGLAVRPVQASHQGAGAGGLA